MGRTAGAEILGKANALCVLLAPHAVARDRDGQFNFEAIRLLGESGLLSLPVRQEAGGTGGSLALAQEVVGKIAHVDASTALILVNHYMIHAAIAARDGWPEALAERLEREAVDRPALINALLAEPDLGSAAQGGQPGVVATRVPGGWRISGRKAYVTGIPALSWLAVRARTEEETPRIGLFLVAAKAEGVDVIPNWDHIGMRATHSHEVELRDVFVPENDTTVLSVADAKGGIGTVLMRWNTGLLGGLYDGIARAALDWTVGFLKARVPSNLGRPLATLPAMQDAIGRINLTLDTNALLLDGYAKAVAAGDAETASRGAPVVKTRVVDGAAEVTFQLLAIAGNAGLSARNGLERCHRDALCGLIHSPHAELLRRIAGQKTLAL